MDKKPTENQSKDKQTKGFIGKFQNLFKTSNSQSNKKHQSQTTAEEPKAQTVELLNYQKLETQNTNNKPPLSNQSNQIKQFNTNNNNLIQNTNNVSLSFSSLFDGFEKLV